MVEVTTKLVFTILGGGGFYEFENVQKLDGVGPDDSRPSNNLLNHKKKIFPQFSVHELVFMI